MATHLKCDSDIPMDHRPTFYFRAVSYDESIGRMAEMWEAFCRAPSTKKDVERAAMLAFVTEYMVGWSNMTHPESGEDIAFSPEAVLQWLTPAELLEIGRDSFYLHAPSVEEKKS